MAGVTVTRDAAPAPPVAVLRVTPNGVGMAGLTEYRFDGSGSSDPNQDALMYSWDFGDGSRASGVTVTHVYRAAGTYEVALTVSDGTERVTARGSVEVGRNVSGRFLGHSVSDGRCLTWDITELFDLLQDGASIYGTYTYIATHRWARTAADRTSSTSPSMGASTAWATSSARATSGWTGDLQAIATVRPAVIGFEICAASFPRARGVSTSASLPFIDNDDWCALRTCRGGIESPHG